MIKIKGIAATMRSLREQVNSEISKQKAKEMDTIVTKLAQATPKDTGEAAAGWKREGDTIVNRVEHIDYLNEGSSQQAPARFVEKTVLEHQGVSPSGIIVKTI